MIRVKLPFGGVTPEQMEAFADVIEKYVAAQQGATSRRARTSRSTTSRCPTRPKLIRELGDAGLSSREGCGNTVRNVTGDPWAGVCEGELFDPTPYAGAYVRYFVRNEVCQLMPRKVKTAFTATDEDRAITGIHDIGFIPRVRDGVRASRCASAAARRSCRASPRRCTTSSAPTTASTSRSPRPCFRIFDRQDWLRVNRARARIKVLVDKIGIDAFREHGRGGARGRLGLRARLRPRPRLFVDDEGGQSRAPDGYGVAQRRQPRIRPLPLQANVRRSARAVRRSRSRSRAATSRPSSSAGSPRSCATSPAATPAPPCSRTWCCAGCATRAVYDVWQRAGRARTSASRRARDHRRRLLPGHRQLQARHHQLDGPERGRQASASKEMDRSRIR